MELFSEGMPSDSLLPSAIIGLKIFLSARKSIGRFASMYGALMMTSTILELKPRKIFPGLSPDDSGCSSHLKGSLCFVTIDALRMIDEMEG